MTDLQRVVRIKEDMVRKAEQLKSPLQGITWSSGNSGYQMSRVAHATRFKLRTLVS